MMISSDTQQAWAYPIISLFEDDETRWRAVQDRNSNADGFFVYCVRTTKIFCRPICKARLARRANVTFYATGREAQTAGFRACKRCKPELAGFMPEEDAVRKIRAFVERDRADDNGAGAQSLSQMARQMGLSKWHFHRAFKKCVGVTPVEYLRMQRRAEKLGGDAYGGTQLHLDGSCFADSNVNPYMIPGDTTPEGSLEVSSDATPLSFEDLLDWPDDTSQHSI